MSVTKFTPGPWVVSLPNRGNTYSVGVQSISEPWRYHVCDVCDDIDQAEYAANANLISAAPELYKALDAIASSFFERCRSGVEIHVSQKNADAMIAALAKARGEE